MILLDYQIDTAALLHDANYQFNTQAQLTRWINQARRQIAYRTGCLRALISGQSPFGAGAQPGTMIPGGITPGFIPSPAPAVAPNPNLIPQTVNNPFNAIAGVEKYDFAYGNQILQAQYQGYKAIIDIVDVAVSWGGIRPNMSWLPWEDLQAYGRSYNIGVFSYPFYWSTNGDGENAQIWLFPCPSIAAEMEWDCLAIPIDLNNNQDYDAIPAVFQDYVKYYAAFLAYQSSQRPGQAAQMLALFEQHIPVSRAASDRGKVPDYYWFESGI